MAERQGFEPWVGANRQRFSRPPHSTTLPPLRGRDRGGALAGSDRACNPEIGDQDLGGWRGECRLFTKAWFGVAWQRASQAVTVVKPILLKAIQMNLPVLFGLILACIGTLPAVAEMPLSRSSDAGLLPVQAPPTPDGMQRILQLSKTLQISAILAVMREEGLAYGTTLEPELFPGKGGASWTAQVSRIYDVAAMQARFDAALVSALADENATSLDVMEGFFGSDRGQRILMLEIEARRALLDDATEDAAKLNVEDMAAEGDPRLAMIRRFAEANDLIEMNVAGALNANLAFFKGMAEAGAFDDGMTEDQMLSNVWSQEPDIRGETETWLYPYLALAYQPLSDDDMDAYLAFSDLDEGKALNAAVFEAFNDLFTSISAELGRAAARQMRGENI